MELYTRPHASRDDREAVLMRWYRQQLREQIPGLIENWESKVGVDVANIRIKKMKNKWGSCTIQSRRIWLNVELIKKPFSCKQYIMVHGMVHLLERHHNERFQKLLDGFLPHNFSSKEFL